jgi:branched-chain amino acid transport system permease protein
MTSATRMRWGLLTILCLLSLSLPAFLPTFTIQLTIRGLYLGVVAMTFILLAGYADMISLAQMSFAAMAGYVIAIGAVKLGISQWVLFPSAIVGATALSAIFGLVAIRGQGIYFLMMTLALGQLFYGIGMQWVSLTGGAYGYTGLSRPTILGYSLLEATPLYYVTLVITILSYLALRRVVRSNFGLVLQGIRDNPKRMAALGFNVQLHRYFAIVISGAFAGVAGILNTYFTGVITPSRAGLSQSVIVVMAALVGGVRRLEGGLLGGILIAFLLSVTNELTPRYWTVIGALFILVVMFLPNGLLGGTLPQLRSIRRWGTQIRPGKGILRSGASPVAGSRQFTSKTPEHGKDEQ